MPNEKPAKTPLHPCHLQLGARMVPFAGYEMPVQYAGVLEETKTVRESGGLFDVSHMGQFSVRGKTALDEVQRLVTNDLQKIQIGQAQYNMLCNDEGGTIDDLVVYRRSTDEIYICVNAGNRRADWEWMRAHLSSSVTFEDQSDETALIAVQGPKAESLLCTAIPEAVVRALKYYWAVDTKIWNRPVYLSRTGYTGEDGFELYVKREDATDIWWRLVEGGRKEKIIPAGLGARDTLRLEMGYPLHGHELSTSITPLAAGLAWVVKLEKTPAFIGQAALKKQAAEGPAEVLRAFTFEDRRIPRQGYRLLSDDGAVMGTITSGTMSPHLNTPIALGFVKKEAASRDRLQVEIRESRVPATVTKLPFVKPRTKKTVTGS